MTFRQLIASLPNGLHDAELRRFEMDYVRRRLQLDLSLWVGDMRGSGSRETYRPAHLNFDEVAFLIIEPPDAKHPSPESGTIRIDAGEGQPPQSKSEIPDAPANTSVIWVYLEEPNTFLLIAAGDASLEWTGAAETRIPTT
jgi:hypothetical protein